MGINIIKKNPTAGEITSSLTGSNDAPGLHFDGTAGNIDIASPPDLGTKFSFEFIIQADEWGSSADYLIDFGTGGRFLFYAEGSTSYNLAIWDTGLRTFGVKVLDDLKVHHLVLTVDGTAAILYDNGNQVGTTTLGASSDIDSCTDARIGARFNAEAGYFFNGTLYRTRFFNRTLSASDVVSLFEKADVSFSDQHGSQTELVTNGDFASATGWGLYAVTIGSGKSSWTATSGGIAAFARRTDWTITKGKRYRLSFTPSSVTATGQLTLKDYAAANTITDAITVSGTDPIITEFVAANSSSGGASLVQINSTFVGDLDDVSCVEIGAVADYDCAFSNPTQSLLIQDRAGNADATASATGISQTSPIEGLNAKALSIGTSSVTPADGVIVADKLGVGGVPAAEKLEVIGASTGGAIAAEVYNSDNGDNSVAELKLSAGALNQTSLMRANSGGTGGGSGLGTYLDTVIANTNTNTSYGGIVFATSNAAGSLAERLTIDLEGNVMIGSGTAGRKLHIKGELAANNTVAAKVENTGTGFSGLDLATDGTDWSMLAWGSGTATPNQLSFYNGTAHALTISSAGSITTTAVSAGGWGMTSSNTSATGWGMQVKGGADSGDRSFEVQSQAGAQLFLVDGAGNAGLGVTPETWTSSRTALQVCGNGAINGSSSVSAGGNFEVTYNAYINSGGNWSAISTGAATMYRQASAAHSFWSAPSVSADATLTFGKSVEINANGGIYEVGGSLKENLLTNSGFDVWSNSTLEEVGSEEVDNGGFGSDVSDWAVSGGAVTWVSSGGQSGGYASTTSGWLYQQLSGLTPGALYKLTAYVKEGSSAGEAAALWVDDSSYAQSDQGKVEFTSTSSWVAHSVVFEAGASNPYITLQFPGYGSGKTIFWDSVSVKQVSPGCVAANNLSFDGTRKTHSVVDMWRQHNDGGTLTHDGSFYSLKMVTSIATTGFCWPASAGVTTGADPVHLQKFAGRTVTMGAWVKTDQASNAKIRMTKDAYSTDTSSAYHTGDNNWQWLEATMDCTATPTNIQFGFQMDGAGDGSATSNNLTYVSQPMLVFGSAIGEGNYSAPSGEIVWCEVAVGIQTNVSPAAADDKILNLEALSNGKIPKGAQSVNLRASVRNSSVTSSQGVEYGPSSSYSEFLAVLPSVNGFTTNAVAWVDCDSNGDIYQKVTEADATLAGLYNTVKAVQLR